MQVPQFPQGLVQHTPDWPGEDRAGLCHQGQGHSSVLVKACEEKLVLECPQDDFDMFLLEIDLDHVVVELHPDAGSRPMPPLELGDGGFVAGCHDAERLTTDGRVVEKLVHILGVGLQVLNPRSYLRPDVGIRVLVRGEGVLLPLHVCDLHQSLFASEPKPGCVIEQHAHAPIREFEDKPKPVCVVDPLANIQGNVSEELTMLRWMRG